MTTTGRTNQSTLRQEAESILSRHESGRLRRWMGSAINAETVSRPPITLTLLVATTLAVVAVWLSAAEPNFMPSRSPEDVPGAFRSLWQVHSAIVALSIPLLILLVEQAHSKTIIATSVGNALMSECRVVLITSFSMGSVILIGLAAVYLTDDSVLLLGLVTSALTILFITSGYWRAMRLLLSPTLLRERSVEVAKRRLATSMSDAFVRRWMNVEMIRRLEPWNAANIGLAYPSKDHACVISSSADGIFHDVSLAELVDVLRDALPDEDEAQLTTAGPTTDELGHGFGDPTPEGRGYELRVAPVGSRVRAGDPLLTVNVKLDFSAQTRIRNLVVIGGEQ